MEAKNQGLEAVSEVAASDPKQLARQLLSEGLDVDAVAEESGLSRPVVLGISGAMKKAQKKLDKAQGEPSLQSGKSNSDEESLIADIKGENTLAANAVLLARNKSRLRLQDPTSFNSLFPSGQPESSTSRLADLEIARYVKNMRLEEETTRHNNGDSQTTLGLQKQIDDLREQLHQKDVQNLRDETTELKQELKEIRSEMRSSGGSNSSDLAVVVRETTNLIGKALESPGVIRNYLLPGDGGYIKDKRDAPLLHTQAEPGGSLVISELAKRGLVTRVQRVGS